MVTLRLPAELLAELVEVEGGSAPTRTDPQGAERISTEVYSAARSDPVRVLRGMSGQSDVTTTEPVERLWRRDRAECVRDRRCTGIGSGACGVHGDVELAVRVDPGLRTGQTDGPISATSLAPVEFLLGAANLDERHVVSLQYIEQILNTPPLAQRIVHDDVVSCGGERSHGSVIAETSPSQDLADLRVIEHTSVNGGAHGAERVNRNEEPGIGQEWQECLTDAALA